MSRSSMMATHAAGPAGEQGGHEQPGRADREGEGQDLGGTITSWPELDSIIFHQKEYICHQFFDEKSQNH